MPFFYFDPAYMLAIAPAMLLAMWAQWRVHATFAAASQEPAPLSGAAAARHILDSAGATEVAVEQVPGTLTDHYDPRTKVLRLSDAVYSSRSLAAVGIANIGRGFGLTVFMFGLMFASRPMAWVGIGLFAATVFFQLVNLPVEIDASNRAKRQLVALGIVPGADMPHVNKVLNSAAWTYVAATLQSALTLIYYASYLTGGDRDSES